MHCRYCKLTAFIWASVVFASVAYAEDDFRWHATTRTGINYFGAYGKTRLQVDLRHNYRDDADISLGHRWNGIEPYIGILVKDGDSEAPYYVGLNLGYRDFNARLRYDENGYGETYRAYLRWRWLFGDYYRATDFESYRGGLRFSPWPKTWVETSVEYDSEGDIFVYSFVSVDIDINAKPRARKHKNRLIQWQE